MVRILGELAIQT